MRGQAGRLAGQAAGEFVTQRLIPPTVIQIMWLVEKGMGEEAGGGWE